MKKHPNRNAKIRTLGACLGVVMTGTAAVHGQDGRMDKLEKENLDLKQRLEALETMAKREGILPSGEQSKGTAVKALSNTSISGFVTASYFYDTSKPPGGVSPGYLWNQKSDSFSLNKVKLTLASPPVERSGDKFDAAYRVSLIFGQDAPIVNTSAGTLGFDNVREAFVEMNVPIGTGLNVRAGELISLLNYESGDGGAVNDNFSQGYQWFFTGNPPSAGVQLGYTFTDWLDLKVRVQNGLFQGPVDNNNAKTVMASIGIKPNDKIWMNLVGFSGREGLMPQRISGGSFLGGWSVTDKFHVGTELDYFAFDTGVGTSDVWSAGGWFSYALMEKLSAAIRAEFISDKDGVDVNGLLGVPPNSGQDIASIAFTLNYKPLPSVKIQPEVRYDHTTLGNGFGTKADRVVLGAGVSYIF
jgi:hypothetical protein